MLLLAGGVGAGWSWAAEVKAPPPAVRNTGAVGAGAVTVPPPAVVSAVPPVAGAAAPQTYSYNPAGKTDPFLPFVETDPAVKKEKEKKAQEEELKKKAVAAKRPISLLQMAEIDQFRLIGIAGDDKMRTAIVEDGTAKKFYPIFVGTNIGPNGGRVVSILNDRLVVEEPIPQAEPGKVQRKKTRTITIMLHKEDEGKP